MARTEDGLGRHVDEAEDDHHGGEGSGEAAGSDPIGEDNDHLGHRGATADPMDGETRKVGRRLGTCWRSVVETLKCRIRRVKTITVYNAKI